MARPLSDDKRTVILEAAAEVVAALGVSGPTAKIAKVAGVAEGTVFTYFATKDELLNQLYLEIKTDLRDAMMTGYPSGKSIARRSRHV
jgi:AcrR family transcriptional regulator